MDARPYIGLPWADGGRGPQAYDCYGLIRLVYRQEYGIELPSLTEAYASALERREVAALLGEDRPLWAETVGEPAEGDVVVLRVNGEPAHLGLVVEPGQMLHVRRKAAACLERYDGLRWRNCVEGFLRWAG